MFSLTGTAAIAVVLAIPFRAATSSRRRLIAEVVVRSLIGATLWLVDLALVTFLFGGSLDEVNAGLWVLLFLSVQSVLGAIVAVRELAKSHRARERELDGARATVAAQLQALRYQLDPHFLFNALNTVAALIREDPKKAEAALSDLGKILRHSLDTDDRSGTVADELEVIQALVALARARFEDDLHVVIEAITDPDLCAQMLPPLLVQPLVENAIEHGMRTAQPPIRIGITLARSGEDLAIDVHNTGILDATPRPGAIGVANLRARLDMLYPNRHTFVLEQRGDRVHATLRLQRAP